MNINDNILFVAPEQLEYNQSIRQSLDKLFFSLDEIGFVIEEIYSIRDAEKRIRTNSSYSLIAFYWSKNDEIDEDDVNVFINTLRERNIKTPLFVISEEDIINRIPLFLLKEISEYIRVRTQ